MSKPTLKKKQFNSSIPFCLRSQKRAPLKDGLNINFPANYSRYTIAIKTMHTERNKAVRAKKLKLGKWVERKFNKFLKDERCETD